jgi:hypothetical protein
MRKPEWKGRKRNGTEIEQKQTKGTKKRIIKLKDRTLTAKYAKHANKAFNKETRKGSKQEERKFRAKRAKVAKEDKYDHAGRGT